MYSVRAGRKIQGITCQSVWPWSHRRLWSRPSWVLSHGTQHAFCVSFFHSVFLHSAFIHQKKKIAKLFTNISVNCKDNYHHQMNSLERRDKLNVSEKWDGFSSSKLQQNETHFHYRSFKSELKEIYLLTKRLLRLQKTKIVEKFVPDALKTI